MHGSRTLLAFLVGVLSIGTIRAQHVEEKVTYRTFDSLTNGGSYSYPDAQPLWYDPVGRVLATIKRGRPEGSKYTYIRMSADAGNTWGDQIGPLFDPNAPGLGRGQPPSMIVVNPEGTSDPAKLLYVYSVPILINGVRDTAIAYGVRRGDGTDLVPATPTRGPDPNDTAKHWGPNAKLAVAATNDVVLMASIIDGRGQNGLALRRMNAVTGAYDVVEPPQWAADRFTPTDSAHRTSTIAGIGCATNNNFILGTFSRFRSSDSDRVMPVPAFSRSTDMGSTWSAFERLPIGIVNQYISANMPGAVPDSVIFTYRGVTDFVVLGGHTFSFVTTLVEIDATKPNPRRHLVEVRVDDGAWSMLKIAETQFRWFAGPGADSVNRMQNELQIAKVARIGNEDTLLVKWVEPTAYIFGDDINGDAHVPDTLNTTDVFIAVRKPDDVWSAPRNVTSDPLLNHITWIPKILPTDIRNVPMLASITSLDGSERTYADSNTTSQLRFNFQARIHYVVTANFDASSSTGGVNEANGMTGSGMRLNAAFPNPAREEVYLTFALPKCGIVTLDVSDAGGRKVATLAAGTMEAGNRGVALSTAALSSGTYFYSLRMNGETVTRSFTVTK